jgi:hypothetical protein
VLPFHADKKIRVLMRRLPDLHSGAVRPQQENRKFFVSSIARDLPWGKDPRAFERRGSFISVSRSNSVSPPPQASRTELDSPNVPATADSSGKISLHKFGIRDGASIRKADQEENYNYWGCFASGC